MLNATSNNSPARALVSRSVGRLYIACHSAQAPSDAEWNEALSYLRAHDPRSLRVLVVTEGGAPSPSQQLALSRLVSISSIPVAVVSEAAAIRFVASSLALFMKNIRTFRLDGLSSAFEHLRLTPDEVRAARSFVEESVTPAWLRSL